MTRQRRSVNLNEADWLSKSYMKPALQQCAMRWTRAPNVEIANVYICRATSVQLAWDSGHVGLLSNEINCQFLRRERIPD